MKGNITLINQVILSGILKTSQEKLEEEQIEKKEQEEIKVSRHSEINMEDYMIKTNSNEENKVLKKIPSNEKIGSDEFEI